jgi:hypothetical protein
MLYAAWYLSGHESWTLDDGEDIFAVLAQCDVPVLPWQRTVLRAGLRSDVNRDATWAGRPTYGV